MNEAGHDVIGLARQVLSEDHIRRLWARSETDEGALRRIAQAAVWVARDRLSAFDRAFGQGIGASKERTRIEEMIRIFVCAIDPRAAEAERKASARTSEAA